MKDRYLLGATVVLLGLGACGRDLPLLEGEDPSGGSPPELDGTSGGDSAGSGDSSGGGESGTIDTSGAQLRVRLTDAPLVGVEQVNVTFDRVEIQRLAPDEAWVTVTSTVQTFDLLALQNGVTADMGLTSLSTGTYGQIRLRLTDAWVVVDGARADLFVPSGAESGLQILHQLELTAGMETDVVLDFDAAASVHQTGAGQWMLRPVLKVADVSSRPVEEEGGSSGAGRRPDAGTSGAERPDAGTSGAPDGGYGAPDAGPRGRPDAGGSGRPGG